MRYALGKVRIIDEGYEAFLPDMLNYRRDIQVEAEPREVLRNETRLQVASKYIEGLLA